jgi:hypothetical protein
VQAGSGAGCLALSGRMGGWVKTTLACRHKFFFFEPIQKMLVSANFFGLAS